MGNAKSKNKNSQQIETEISRNLKQTSLTTTTEAAATILHGKEDNQINVGEILATTSTATTVGGPLLLEIRKTTTTVANSNKANKDLQQQTTKLKQRQQKAADNSADSEVAEQQLQRLKQVTSPYMFGFFCFLSFFVFYIKHK